MGRTNVLTLTCPHCARQLRVGIEHAGWRTRCPHPDCRRSLTIPLDLDHDDEPDEAVLIAEGPPQPIAVVPRRGPRDSPARATGRGRAVLWVLTGLLVGATIAVAVGWTLVRVWRARSAEATADAVGPGAAPPRRAAPPSGAPALPPPDLVPDVPVPQPAEPNRANPGARGRDAFVGRWVAVDLPVMQPKLELSVEFRDDGTCEMVVNGLGGVGGQQRVGKWRWEDDRLTLEFTGTEGRPATVKWNGPDEFVATTDATPVTFRRQ